MAAQVSGQDPARLATQQIFAQLIEDEIRAGRLTARRRKRILRYAVQLRLSAVDAGIMVRQIQERVADAQSAQEASPPLRFRPPPPPARTSQWRIWTVVAVAIMLDAAFLVWVW